MVDLVGQSRGTYGRRTCLCLGFWNSFFVIGRLLIGFCWLRFVGRLSQAAAVNVLQISISGKTQILLKDDILEQSVANVFVQISGVRLKRASFPWMTHPWSEATRPRAAPGRRLVPWTSTRAA